MKICISTLLLAIKVFLRLDEINASGVQGASSSSGRAPPDDLINVEKDPKDGPHHKIVHIGNQKIELWLDNAGRNVVKAWCGPYCRIPKPDFFKKNDCLIRVHMREGLKFVAYISRNNVLLGVRAPQQPGEQKYRLEPTPSLFYLIHAGSAFKVQFNTGTERATAISLVPENYPQYYEKAFHVKVADLKLTVFKGGPLDQIMGAVLGYLLPADISRLKMIKKQTNLSGVQGASLSFRRAPPEDLIQVEKDPKDGPHHKTVYIGDQKIELWLDNSRRNVVKAWYEPYCRIPKPDFFPRNDCLIRVFIREGLKLVAYMAKNNVLIGVRAPQQPGEQKYSLEPTPSLFYLIHSGYTFKVEFNIVTEQATAISLVPENYPQYYEHKLHVKVADLEFTVFRGGPHDHIVGAELGFLSPEQISRVKMNKRVKTEYWNEN